MRKEKGNVLIVALIMLIVISGISVATLMLISRQSRSADWNYRSTRAYYAAETGIEMKVSKINASGVTAANLQKLTGGLDGADYETTLQDWSKDKVDNDNNGKMDDASEAGYYWIDSTGTYNGARRKLRVTARFNPAVIPQPFGAVNLYNPKDANGNVVPGTLVNFSGVTPPHIDGRDANIPPGTTDFGALKSSSVTLGSGPLRSLLGVSTHDNQSVTDINKEIAKNPARVYGIDSSAYPGPALADYFFSTTPPAPVYAGNSAANVNSFDPNGAQEIVNDANYYASFAQNVYTSTNYPKGNAVFGTLSDPQITYINNPTTTTMKLNGNIAGVGILVLKGNVDFGGTFNFAGLIFCIAEQDSIVNMEPVDLRGTPLIMGAIYGASVKTNASGGAPILLDIRGTPDIFYSSQAIDLAKQAIQNLGKINILSVSEIGAS